MANKHTGWGKLYGGKKAHYYKDGESVCIDGWTRHHSFVKPLNMKEAVELGLCSFCANEAGKAAKSEQRKKQKREAEWRSETQLAMF